MKIVVVSGGFDPIHSGHIAYFKAGTTESIPEYQIQMDLHDNGVVTDFMINYGDFTVHASISDAQLIEKVDCM